MGIFFQSPTVFANHSNGCLKQCFGIGTKTTLYNDGSPGRDVNGAHCPIQMELKQKRLRQTQKAILHPFFKLIVSKFMHSQT